MPITLNVGVSRKVADNNYGSRGCSVNLEIELDASLIQEPDRLQERIRQVFRLAQQSVDEELARQQPGNGTASHAASPAIEPPQANGNGTNGSGSNGSGSNGQRRSNGRRATASQARALRAIADRHGLDLAAELHGRFGVEQPEALSINEASELIDSLKSAANGNGRRG